MTGATEGSYSVAFATRLSSGTALPATAVGVDVAKPGELRPYYTSIGVSSDGQVTSSGYKATRGCTRRTRWPRPG